MANYNTEVTFEIKEHFGVINPNNNGGWSKEVNFVSWNDKPPKFDIRDWDANHERMSRGITLCEEDAKKLYEILDSVFNSEK